MKVHLIKKQTIENFAVQNARSRVSFETWITVIKSTDWEQPSDILLTFNSADILGNGSDRVVFNIGGNNYRMICKYQFGKNRVHIFIKWIGTHAEYTELCSQGKQYSIDIF